MKKCLLLLPLSLLILQACGQTGPLYISNEEAPIHVPKDEQ